MKVTQILCLFASCLPMLAQAQMKQTPKGIRYQILERKAGNVQYVELNDYVTARLYTYNFKDSLLGSQEVKDSPIAPATSAIDVRDVVPYLAVGDSAICFIKTDTLAKYSGRPLPAFLPAGTDLKHIIRIVKAKKPAEYEREKGQDGKAQRDADQKIITDYANANNLKTIVTPSGLHYIITKQGTGAKPVQGRDVTVHYRGTLLSGKEFDSSYGRNQPFSFPLGKGQVIKGWDEGIALLNGGSKATLLIPSDLAYGSHGAGADISANAVLKFEVELIDVPLQNVEKAMNIAEYVKVNNLKTMVTPSGLHYIITTQGKGAKPNKGQNVKVHYRGTLLTGKEFDSSYTRNQPLDFVVGVGQVIKGWDEGLMLMNVGTRATFIIPAELAYGSSGAGGGAIPPDAPLRFDVELIEVK